MKLDILVIAAHPDDAELSIGATIIKHIEMGYKVGVLDLTAGELGTRGNPEIRAEEAATASKIMGLHVRDNAKLPDGFFELDSDNKLKIVPYIRKYRPEIVLCNAVNDRHPDHGRAGKLVADACFLSGLRKIDTTFESGNQEAWRPKQVYHYIQEYSLQPDFVVDVSGYMERKIEAFMAFKSQFFDPNSREPETKISQRNYTDFIRSRAVICGNYIGVEYGEGFNILRPIGVDDVFSIK